MNDREEKRNEPKPCKSPGPHVLFSECRPHEDRGSVVHPNVEDVFAGKKEEQREHTPTNMKRPMKCTTQSVSN